MLPTTPDSTIIARNHPMEPINPWVTRGMINWPREPPALTIPKVMLRRFGGTIRAVPARTIENPVPPMASPTNNPPPM